MGYFICTLYTIASLNNLMTVSGNLSEDEAGAEKCDLVNFMDLLTQMLMLDAAEKNYTKPAASTSICYSEPLHWQIQQQLLVSVCLDAVCIISVLIDI